VFFFRALLWPLTWPVGLFRSHWFVQILGVVALLGLAADFHGLFFYFVLRFSRSWLVGLASVVGVSVSTAHRISR
jgi:hypothetical protein